MENTITLALPASTIDWDAIHELFNKVVDAVRAVAQAICNLVKTIFNRVTKALNKCIAPPRVFELAYHARKHRVRKKNRRRIMKIWEGLL